MSVRKAPRVGLDDDRRGASRGTARSPRRREALDQAEVEERHAAVGAEQVVARVRVAVERVQAVERCGTRTGRSPRRRGRARPAATSRSSSNERPSASSVVSTRAVDSSGTHVGHVDERDGRGSSRRTAAGWRASSVVVELLDAGGRAARRRAASGRGPGTASPARRTSRPALSRSAADGFGRRRGTAPSPPPPGRRG